MNNEDSVFKGGTVEILGEITISINLWNYMINNILKSI